MPLIFGSVSPVSCEFVMLDGDVKLVHHSTFCVMSAPRQLML